VKVTFVSGRGIWKSSTLKLKKLNCMMKFAWVKCFRREGLVGEYQFRMCAIYFRYCVNVLLFLCVNRCLNILLFIEYEYIFGRDFNLTYGYSIYCKFINNNCLNTFILKWIVNLVMNSKHAILNFQLNIMCECGIHHSFIKLLQT